MRLRRDGGRGDKGGVGRRLRSGPLAGGKRPRGAAQHRRQPPLRPRRRRQPPSPMTPLRCLNFGALFPVFPRSRQLGRGASTYMIVSVLSTARFTREMTNGHQRRMLVYNYQHSV